MLTAAFLLPCLQAVAQDGLNIGAVFDEYGMKKGSVLIELGKDVLGKHTKIDLYKSLVAAPDSLMLKKTGDAVLYDFAGNVRNENCAVIKESMRDGKLLEAVYCLGESKESSGYRYILFSGRSRKMTLIYIVGKFPPRQLENELSTLKNLFIKVNNQKIKL
jgi:hypothetical protein